MFPSQNLYLFFVTTLLLNFTPGNDVLGLGIKVALAAKK